MPRVPVINQPSVQPTAMPTPYDRTQPPGQGVEQFANAVQNIGAKMFEDEKRKMNKARVNGATAEVQQFSTELVARARRERQGIKAGNVTDDVLREFDEAAGKRRVDLTPDQQEAYDADVSRERDSLLRQMSAYELQEWEAVDKGNLDARLGQAIDKGAQLAHDDVEVQNRREDGIRSLREYGETHGWTPEQLESAERNFLTNYHLTVLETMARDFNPKAETYLEVYGTQIDAKRRVDTKIDELVKGRTLAGKSRVEADRIRALHPGDYEAQKQEAAKIEDTRLFDAVMDRIDRENTRDNHAQSEREKETVAGISLDVRANPSMSLQEMREREDYLTLSQTGRDIAEKTLRAAQAERSGRASEQKRIDDEVIQRFKSLTADQQLAANVEADAEWTGVSPKAYWRMKELQKLADEDIKKGRAPYRQEVVDVAASIATRMKFTKGQKNRFVNYMIEWWRSNIDKEGKPPPRAAMWKEVGNALMWGDTSPSDSWEFNHYRFDRDAPAKDFYAHDEQPYTPMVQQEIEKEISGKNQPAAAAKPSQPAGMVAIVTPDGAVHGYAPPSPELNQWLAQQNKIKPGWRIQ